MLVIDQNFFKDVYNIVAKYDPVGIAHCSDDEYKTEVTEICTRAYILTEKELAKHIYNVFRFWFTESVIPHPKSKIYREMAKEIKALFPKDNRSFRK
mgnify:FL=1